ncbi:MAG: hypothetical protein HKN13_04100 [Rhodothermales bacterium]|nr:hypothetical protein [Rhodothermales bacterium]
MKLALLLVVSFCFAAIVAIGAGEEFQIWTNQSGQTMEARFVSLEGNVITFENKRGQKFQYAAGDLNLDGQSLVAKLARETKYRNLPPFVRLRCLPAAREQAIAEGGGAAESEAAVLKGLTWLAAQQDPASGSFGKEFTAGMTGLSLLAFLGHCETPDSPQWGNTVVNAALHLMELSKQEDGLIFNGEKGAHASYEHAIATYALAELYSMTRDSGKAIPDLEKVLEEAVDIIADGQTKLGGWEYGYRDSGRSDMSLSGWQLQALRAARHCGGDYAKLDRKLDKSMEYMKQVQDDKGAFKYTPSQTQGKPSLTGAALYNFYMWGEKSSPEYALGIAYLADVYSNPSPGTNFYSPYYNTLAFFAHGGAEWQSYQDKFMAELIDAQNEDGSFLSETASGQAAEDNQLMNTTWAIMMMEIYYRYPRTPDSESLK